MARKIKNRLSIRVDASPQMGTGHLMRCLSLAQRWKDSGRDVVFITCCESERSIEKIKKEGFRVYGVQKSSDIEDTRDILEKEKPDWVVLDGYHFGPEYQRAIKVSGYKLLVIDDYAHLEYYYADIILNQNYGSEKFSYNAEPHTRFLLGTKYVLLRREFLHYSDYERQIPDVAKKVLITMGGGDPENNTLKVLRAINLIDTPLDVRVIIGASNPHYALIKQKAEGCRHNIEILRDVKDMAPLMGWADVAVSAGGTTTWELAFMGLPSMLCIVADNQENTVNALQKEGFLSAGWIEELNISNTAKLFKKLINDKNLRCVLTEKSRQTVDGKGVDKAIKEMTKKTTKILFLGGNMSGELSDWLRLQDEEVLYTEEKINKEFVKKVSPDIIISYNYSYILKTDILNIPKIGAINLHISYLPWNRGASPNVWSFVDNTPKGVTIHYIDKGIDTGDILLQKEVFIDEERETLKTSYEKLHREIQDMFKASWDKLREGKIKSQPQTKEGTLHYANESQFFEPLIREKGWDILIKEFKEKFRLLIKI